MNRIYVFSATGTSLQVARDIASKLPDTEVLSIPKLMKGGNWSISGDRIGFIFPCYYGQAPFIIRDFILNADSIDGKYFFGVATAGGDSGYSLKRLGEYLSARDITLSYSNQIIIASNYMNGWYYNMLLPNKQTLKKRIQASELKASEISQSITERETSLHKNSYLNYILPRLISPRRYVDDTRPHDSEFSVSSSCNNCGTCAKVCPADNISITTNGPEFAHKCHRCMACIQYCPQSSFMISGKPMDKEKYTHPDVSLNDMISFNN